MPKLAKAGLIGCFSLTERDFGSDPGSMITRAEKIRGRLHQRRQDVDLQRADRRSRHCLGEARWQIRGFIVERGTKGFSTPKVEASYPCAPRCTGEIVLEDAVVLRKKICCRTSACTPSFVGMKYSDDFIILELAFISGRPKETRLALLKELNARIVAGAAISPDDLMIQLSEGPGENFSFGQGLAQRASVSQAA